MELTDFLKRLRGKITGLNAISVRLDILQMQLDRLLANTTKSNAAFTALKPLPEVSPERFALESVEWFRSSAPLKPKFFIVD